MQIKKRDEWKTSFWTRYEDFEYNVIPFGLTIAPTIFQYLMNDVFQEFSNKFILYYLNNILIYSKSLEEHEEYI